LVLLQLLVFGFLLLLQRFLVKIEILFDFRNFGFNGSLGVDFLELLVAGVDLASFDLVLQFLYLVELLLLISQFFLQLTVEQSSFGVLLGSA